GEDEYYFVYNTNPSNDIIIKGSFNGIIFTTGTVTLEGGANVKGSIIAAGGGEYNADGLFEPRAKYGIDINESTLNELDSGKFAGVIFKYGENGGTINVDFYLGLEPNDVLGAAGADFIGRYEMLNKAARINLLQKLNECGIDLRRVF
ncbi:MAG TPA: polymer-forming cytoskeletal protein, partial [Acetivibrio saccincola]|nr:polymer-forming cytoskeletal protein [Acetivibrio saccincola]